MKQAFVLSDQIIDERTFSYIEVFYFINEGKMTNITTVYHPNELMALNNNHQYLITSKHRDNLVHSNRSIRYYLCGKFVQKRKRNNLNLIKHLGTPINLWEICDKGNL